MDFMEKIWKHFFSMHISTFETIFDLGKNTMGGKVPFLKSSLITEKKTIYSEST